MNLTPCTNNCINGDIVVETNEKDANGYPVVHITPCPCGGSGQIQSQYPLPPSHN